MNFRIPSSRHPYLVTFPGEGVGSVFIDNIRQLDLPNNSALRFDRL